VRATLGQLLFSGDDQKKSLKVISGGEGQRMIIGGFITGSTWVRKSATSIYAWRLRWRTMAPSY